MFGHCTSDKNNAGEYQPEGYISGEVRQIQPGKDGYTAKIMTADYQVYFATISIPNLGKNAAQYREVEVGETIGVKGEVWEMNGETHITVRELK